VPEKIRSKRKTAAGRKNQHLIQLLHTRIFGTGRATEIMYIMTVAPPARGELTIGSRRDGQRGYSTERTEAGYG
jgi:hypothetical protein